MHLVFTIAYDRWLFGLILVLLAQASHLLVERSYKCFPHVNKMPSFIYNWVSSCVVKKKSVLNLEIYTFYKIVHKAIERHTFL